MFGINSLFTKKEYGVDLYVGCRNEATKSIMEIVDMESLLGKKYSFVYDDKDFGKLIFRFNRQKDRDEFLAYANKYVDFLLSAKYCCKKGEAVR